MYFNYERAPYISSKWMIYAPIIVEISVLLSEFLSSGTAYFQLLTIPLLLYYVYRVMKHKEDIDKAKEAQIVEDKLQKSISELANGDDNSIIAKDYFIIVPKEEYLSIKRCMLVVLVNGDVYRYGVEHAEDDGFVINTQATLCTDEKELALVKKYTRKLHKNAKAGIEIIMSLLAAGILIFGLAIVVSVLWFGSRTAWLKYVGYALMGDLLGAIILATVLSLFEKKGKFVGALYKAAILNLQILWLMIQLVFPSMLILMGLIFVIFLPFSIVNIVLRIIASEVFLNEETIMFISLSMGAIISAHYTKPLFALISRLLTANGHRHEKYFPMMVEYVYKPANIQFLVYFLYVAYLSISTVYRLQTGGLPIWESDTDLAVLESFLVFVAFSNMKAKHESTKFKFSELFKIMWAMWTTHDYDGNEKDEEKQA